MTLGDVYPRLRELGPEYEELANRPVDTPPGLLAMAGNLVRAVAGHVADGGRTATPEVRAERLALCRACPRLDRAADRCLSCGCVAMDLKRSWASSACPDGRWPAGW